MAPFEVDSQKLRLGSFTHYQALFFEEIMSEELRKRGVSVNITKEKEKYEEAKRRFVIQGLTLKKIGEDLRVKPSTMKTWHYRYDWSEEREEYLKRLDNTLFENISSELTESCSVYIKASKQIGEICGEQIDRIYQEYKSKKDPKKDDYLELQTSLNEWGKILKNGAYITRAVNPQADKDVYEEILKELRRLGK